MLETAIAAALRLHFLVVAARHCRYCDVI